MVDRVLIAFRGELYGRTDRVVLRAARTSRRSRPTLGQGPHWRSGKGVSRCTPF